MIIVSRWIADSKSFKESSTYILEHNSRICLLWKVAFCKLFWLRCLVRLKKPFFVIVEYRHSYIIQHCQLKCSQYKVFVSFWLTNEALTMIGILKEDASVHLEIRGIFGFYLQQK